MNGVTGWLRTLETQIIQARLVEADPVVEVMQGMEVVLVRVEEISTI